MLTSETSVGLAAKLRRAAVRDGVNISVVAERGGYSNATGHASTPRIVVSPVATLVSACEAFDAECVRPLPTFPGHCACTPVPKHLDGKQLASYLRSVIDLAALDTITTTVYGTPTPEWGDASRSPAFPRLHGSLESLVKRALWEVEYGAYLDELLEEGQLSHGGEMTDAQWETLVALLPGWSGAPGALLETVRTLVPGQPAPLVLDLVPRAPQSRESALEHDRCCALQNALRQAFKLNGSPEDVRPALREAERHALALDELRPGSLWPSLRGLRSTDDDASPADYDEETRRDVWEHAPTVAKALAFPALEPATPERSPFPWPVAQELPLDGAPAVVPAPAPSRLAEPVRAARQAVAPVEESPGVEESPSPVAIAQEAPVDARAPKLSPLAQRVRAARPVSFSSVGY